MEFRVWSIGDLSGPSPQAMNCIEHEIPYHSLSRPVTMSCDLEDVVVEAGTSRPPDDDGVKETTLHSQLPPILGGRNSYQ